MRERIEGSCEDVAVFFSQSLVGGLVDGILRGERIETVFLGVEE